ncbi:exonuclease subunit SbcD, partial [Arthrospira platensis SPKY1]|nr:exonuclease subunit SbcD [Arthrospira platensis SPKY1]
MKILHTADWHLGKKIEGLSRIDEQIAVMEEICSIADAEAVNAVLIAGDVFDTYNPSIEAEELFFKTVYRLSGNGSRVVLVIAGNHDSPDRIRASDPLAVQNGIFLLGYPHTIIKKVKLDSGIEVIRSESGFAEFSLPACNRNMR